MIIHGRDGWPIETIKGRPVLNFIRLLIHGRIGMTWKRRRETYGK